MSLTPDLDGLVTEGDKVLKSLLEQAYARGAADMQARILNAASGLANGSGPEGIGSNGKATRKVADAPSSAKPAKPRKSKQTKSPSRAPRGALDAALFEAVSTKPGLRVRDYEAMVLEIEPKASVTSIGNTLRRLEGKKYRNDSGRWYIKKK